MLNIIVCIARNGAIGLNNHLLYHLRADMKQFKSLTTGNTIIMGRRTFESLPKGALPKRRNIVVTHQNLTFEGAETYHSLDDALAHCAPGEEVFIIGGASVYTEAPPRAQRLYLTEVDDVPAEADTFFPDIVRSEWRELEREHHEADEQNDKPFDFVTLERIC
jgi:dihydrofolate reductase